MKKKLFAVQQMFEGKIICQTTLRYALALIFQFNSPAIYHKKKTREKDRENINESVERFP